MLINWIKLSNKQPPVGLYVLTYAKDTGYPSLESDKLIYSNHLDHALDALEWASERDLDAVSHWAYLENLP